MENYFFIDGTVTSPLGFTANGVCAGIKAYMNGESIAPAGKRDLAIIYCEAVQRCRDFYKESG